jgi:hypothetical protein
MMIAKRGCYSGVFAHQSEVIDETGSSFSSSPEFSVLGNGDQLLLICKDCNFHLARTVMEEFYGGLSP